MQHPGKNKTKTTVQEGAVHDGKSEYPIKAQREAPQQEVGPCDSLAKTGI